MTGATDPTVNLQVSTGVILEVSTGFVLAVHIGKGIGCVGTPDFDYQQSFSWPVFGPTIEWATYNGLTKQLLVIYVDQTYTIIDGVGSFNYPNNTEPYILGLIENLGSHC